MSEGEVEALPHWSEPPSGQVPVVGADDTIRHVQITPEIATEPNYDAALAALKSAAGA